MEGLTTTLPYKDVIKGCWRRRGRGYQRLAAATSHTGGQEEKPRRRRRRRRRRFRINLRLKLKLKLKPRKLFIGLRDAYVRIMMKLANSSCVVRGRTMSGREGFGTMTVLHVQEYDEKMMLEIYKTLAMRQGRNIP